MIFNAPPYFVIRFLKRPQLIQSAIYLDSGDFELENEVSLTKFYALYNMLSREEFTDHIGKIGIWITTTENQDVEYNKLTNKISIINMSLEYQSINIGYEAFVSDLYASGDISISLIDCKFTK